jgi:hypothetical protein
MRTLFVALVLLIPSIVAACCGDCDGDGRVQVNELFTAVSNALSPVCPVGPGCCGDCNGDTRVDIDELFPRRALRSTIFEVT